MARWVAIPFVVIPALREWLVKPLDSSLRWNDGGGCGWDFFREWQRGCRDDDKPISTSVVIYGQEVLYAARGQDARSRPAKAGIQEGGGAVVNG